MEQEEGIYRGKGSTTRIGIHVEPAYSDNYWVYLEGVHFGPLEHRCQNLTKFDVREHRSDQA
jgi:hypothetical protein